MDSPTSSTPAPNASPSPSSPPAAAPRSFALRLSLVTGVLAGLIALGGTHYYRTERESLRTNIGRELDAIANLKVAQITNWRNDRLKDARFLMGAPFVARDVAALLAQPNSAADRAEVRRWLTLIKDDPRYELAMVLDPGANARLTIPDPAGTLAPRLRDLLTATLAARDVVMADLDRADTDSRIYIDLLVPIFPPGQQPATAETPPPAERPAPIAIIVLRLNPERFLFPLIQSWPRPKLCSCAARATTSFF
jgi:hypothetical protein